MIPLRTPAEIKKFPTLLLLLLFISTLLTLLFSTSVSSADAYYVRNLLSFIVFPSWPLGCLCVWYLWIFYPCFELRSPKRRIFDFLLPPSALLLAAVFFHYGIEAAAGFVFTFMLFGFTMRNLIWENVDTLVIGPKLFSVFSVPSYVHVFFFLFYLFIAQLIRPAYGMPGKTIYLVSLVSFLVGFLIRSLELKGLKETPTSI